MHKNFTFLFLLGIFGLFTTNLFAQQDATIDPADIRYWIGEGENEVVFIVNWAEPDTALAWGYRFAGESVSSILAHLICCKRQICTTTCS